ncbi:MAG: hypothetical protein HOK60_07085, partial [Planctomycetes bacterium]|nr:hypothetical protein [Planctomycetota bacterium]
SMGVDGGRWSKGVPLLAATVEGVRWNRTSRSEDATEWIGSGGIDLSS